MINIQPIEKRQESDGSVLSIHSIFFTIQGEGPFCGHPAIFIRLAGCNLQCPSCDTVYTTGRTLRSVDKIIADVEYITVGFKPLIVITGGEPFRQNITPLSRALYSRGYKVQIETNGTLPPSPNFPKDVVTIICSPKAGKINTELAMCVDAYKYVLSHDSINPDDGLPYLALNHTASPMVARPPDDYIGPIYLQPMDSQDEVENALNLEAVKNSCMKYGYLLQVQLHKIIGVA